LFALPRTLAAEVGDATASMEFNLRCLVRLPTANPQR
jgi:hypothetical protein